MAVAGFPALGGADIAYLNGTVNDISVAGQTYGAASSALGLTLFTSFAFVGAMMYYNDYVATNGSSHGVEIGLVRVFQTLAFPFVIMLGVGAGIPTLMPTIQWLCGQVTGVFFTGPASILAMGIVLGIRIIQEPAQVVIANLPPPDALPLAPGIIKNSVQAVQLAQHSGVLLIAGISTGIAFFVALFVWVCFAWITAQYIVAVARISFVVPIRAFEMAWSAMPGTNHWAMDFYSSIRTAAMQLLIITALAAFIALTIGHWAKFTAPPVGAPINLMVYVVQWSKLISGSFIFGALAFFLPRLMTEGSGSAPSVGAAEVGTVARKSVGG